VSKSGGGRGLELKKKRHRKTKRDRDEERGKQRRNKPGEGERLKSHVSFDSTFLSLSPTPPVLFSCVPFSLSLSLSLSLSYVAFQPLMPFKKPRTRA